MLEICGLDKIDIEEHFTEGVRQANPMAPPSFFTNKNKQKAAYDTLSYSFFSYILFQ